MVPKKSDDDTLNIYFIFFILNIEIEIIKRRYYIKKKKY